MMVSWRCFTFFWVVCLLISPEFVEGRDIDLTAPTMKFFGVVIPHTAWDPILNEFEEEIRGTSDIWKYTSPRNLVRGFANAGAAAAHGVTQRSHLDYQKIAFVYGGARAISLPKEGLFDPGDPLMVPKFVKDLENDGDAYIGIASSPEAYSLGVNLGSWGIDRLRVNMKLGFNTLPASFKIMAGEFRAELSHRSTAIGFGADYKIVKTWIKSSAFRWHGVTIGSGLNYLGSRVVTELTIKDGSQSVRTPVTQSGLGVTIPGAPETIGHLVFSPGIGARVEIYSQAWLIPLEVSTGIGLLNGLLSSLINVDFGFGVDFAFGYTKLSLRGANTEFDFEPADGIHESQYSVDLRSASIEASEESRPQFMRPRFTGGIGVNLGPFSVNIPAMYYFDQEGSTFMLGLNFGIVW